MTSTNNDINLDLFNDIRTQDEVQTRSEDLPPRAAFIQKCIHPPSAVPNFEGLPTNDARSQVLLQWRNVQLMANPYIWDYTVHSVRAVTAADLTTFNYAILCMNGARVLSVPFIYNRTSNTMDQDYNNVDTQDAFDFTNWHKEANLYRPAYRSVTTYLNATAFNNTGMVVGQQFNPNILFGGTLTELALTNPKVFYLWMSCAYKRGQLHTHRENACSLDTPCEMWDELPKYIREETSRVLGLPPTTHFELDPNTNLQIFNVGIVGNGTGTKATCVPTASQILNNSMRSYAGKAYEGTFSVSRLNTLTPSWLAGSNTYVGSITPQNGLYQCYVMTTGTDGLPHIAALYDNAKIGDVELGLTVLLDTLWSKDMTWNWVLYEGLSMNSQTSVSTQLLIKKYYTGYEVQPTPKSAWAGMIQLAPKPDIMSLQALMDAFYDLKDTLPAKYNFLGTLASLIPLIPSAVDAISSIFKKKATISEPSEKVEKRRPPRYKIPKRRIVINRPVRQVIKEVIREKPPPPIRPAPRQRKPRKRENITIVEKIQRATAPVRSMSTRLNKPRPQDAPSKQRN